MARPSDVSGGSVSLCAIYESYIQFYI
jgi:hypothetical protein